MATIDDGELYLEIEGASEDQLQRGLRAARHVLANAECSIEDAFQAYFDRENADMCDALDDTPAVVFAHAKVLDDAMAAALQAAEVGWPDNPPGMWNLGVWEAVERSNRELAERGAQRPETGPHYRMASTATQEV